MNNHLLAKMNPERYLTQEPMNPEYRDQAIRDAEAFLRKEGYKLRAEESEPSLFSIVNNAYNKDKGSNSNYKAVISKYE
jgi:hypothetical protein